MTFVTVRVTWASDIIFIIITPMRIRYEGKNTTVQEYLKKK